MHEMSLMSNLFEKIKDLARKNNAKCVKKIYVKLGVLSHMSAKHFKEHFEQGARGTVAEKALLEVVESSDPRDPHAQDIYLESVDLEVDEDSL